MFQVMREAQDFIRYFSGSLHCNVLMLRKRTLLFLIPFNPLLPIVLVVLYVNLWNIFLHFSHFKILKLIHIERSRPPSIFLE